METKEWTLLREGWMSGAKGQVYVSEDKSKYRIDWDNGESEEVDFITGIRICIAMDDEVAEQFSSYAEATGLGTFDPWEVVITHRGTVVGVRNDDGSVTLIATVRVSSSGYEFEPIH
jgi:hypothetical protein